MNDDSSRQNGRHKSRWYDQIGEMTLALHVSKQLPPEIQSVIAKNLNEAIDECRKLRRNDRNAVSLGAHRVLGLYKAGNRKRWYDPNPQLHRGLNLMSTVPDTYIAAFADRILRVGDYMREQQVYLEYGAQALLADTVEGILREAVVQVEAGDDGIRLVSGGKPRNGNGARSILTLPQDKPHRPR